MAASALTKELVRKLRAREQWLRYDSLVVGRNSTKATSSWYETMADFANADSLAWGDGVRKKGVGRAYTNSGGETEDWAQLVYQSGVEFIAPIGMLPFEEEIVDAAILPQIWTTELPQRMSFAVSLQDVDNVLLVPGAHLPGGTGATGVVAEGAGALNTYAGSNGPSNLRATWTWPTPLPIAAKSKLVVSATIDKPLRGVLQGMEASPDSKQLVVPSPNGETTTVEYPNWFVIRVWHRGPRSVQLRGAYSQGDGTQ